MIHDDYFVCRRTLGRQTNTGLLTNTKVRFVAGADILTTKGDAETVHNGFMSFVFSRVIVY